MVRPGAVGAVTDDLGRAPAGVSQLDLHTMGNRAGRWPAVAAAGGSLTPRSRPSRRSRPPTAGSGCTALARASGLEDIGVSGCRAARLPGCGATCGSPLLHRRTDRAYRPAMATGPAAAVRRACAGAHPGRASRCGGVAADPARGPASGDLRHRAARPRLHTAPRERESTARTATGRSSTPPDPSATMRFPAAGPPASGAPCASPSATCARPWWTPRPSGVCCVSAPVSSSWWPDRCVCVCVRRGGHRGALGR